MISSWEVYITSPSIPNSTFRNRMNPSWLSPLLSALKGAWNFTKQRTPFRIKATVSRLPLTVVVTISNHTKDFPLHVRAVRVHFGMASYSSFFQLTPYETVEIKPGVSVEFDLPFNDNIMGRVHVSKGIPTDLNEPNEPPPWESPAQLFLAIARGNPKDSWIEVDFNELTGRRFLRGSVQTLFYIVTKNPPPKPKK